MPSLPSPALAYRLEAARAVVHDAARLAMSMRPPPGGPQGELKSAQDWLTETDGAVEAFIAQRMQALFPEDGFQGEEGGISRTGACVGLLILLMEHPTMPVVGAGGACPSV